MAKLDAKAKERAAHASPSIQNRAARHDYHLLDRVEAGLVLKGPEVKSVRRGRAELRDAFARVQGGEVWLHNMHISPFEQAHSYNTDPTRPRKLLLHRKEIDRLVGALSRKGLTLVPTRLYFHRGYAKVELAVAKSKSLHDRREDLRRRAAEEDVRNEI